MSAFAEDPPEPPSNDFFRLIVENSEDLFAVLDLDGRRLYNSPSYAQLFGDIDHMKGSDSFAEIHPEDRESVKAAFRETVQTGHSHRLSFRFVLADGVIRVMESCGVLIRSSQGTPLRVVVVSRDVTERMKSEEKIYNLAFYDALTQLPNRRLLSDRLEQAMAASKRSGEHGAVMLLDLDNFKALNDIHGHNMGDALLKEVGRRITTCLRETDTVARFGGDEFVLVLGQLEKDRAESNIQANVVAEKVREILAKPYVLKQQTIGGAESELTYHCSASIGVVLFINHEFSIEDVLKQADIAMYQAKRAGRNSIQYYDPKASSSKR
ncbi:MAG: GGDEF domain-containing protein [Sulfuritalea sp.]|nr:GGDEF domain-containing protein [Sulfuritalea sp.]